MLDVLEKAAEHGMKLGATFVELRAELVNHGNTRYEDGRVRNIGNRIEEGVGIRVLADGAWGFVSTSSLSLSKLKTSVKDACSLAASAGKARHEPIKLADVKPLEDTVRVKFERIPTEVEPLEKIKYADKLWRECQRLDSRMSSITIGIRDSMGTKYIVTSEGTKLELGMGHVYLGISLTGKEGTKVTGAREAYGSTSQGWEFIEEGHPPSEVADHLVKLVQKQLAGISPKPGSFACVLAPKIVGTLAHEALGHLAEADLTLQSAFAGKMGQKVAPKGVYMIDDGTLAGGVGSVKYDDEGVPTSRVEIIKDGILNGLLTDREYAQRMSVPVTGNARSEDYRYTPLIRMRNTFFERGESADDELFKDIDFGYYCVSMMGGQVKLDSSFQVGVQEAYEIVNGEVGRPVTNMSISGVATDALQKIEALGSETFEFEEGYCGKGQAALVSDGGPLIRFGKGPIAFGGKAE
ncbi:MAG: metallopeptidase TldD-related protein [Promethearchaeota archaeon]